MKIAITLTGANQVKQQNYERWIRGNDNVEILTIASDADVQRLNECQGLVLTGGVDVHPDYYHGSTDYPHADAWRRDRDEYEIRTFLLAVEKGLPVVGVCRGLQLINVIMGGTLIQDLGDDTGNPVHRKGPDDNQDKEHRVIVKPDTLLHAITGATEGRINSAHHQAIGALGASLRVNAQAEDGTIEGIEWEEPEGKSFFLAVQWHPERMNDMQSPFSRNIRDRFMAEAQRR